MDTFEVGQLAPEFALPDQNGALHRLSDYRGKWIVLYFYPKDDTPGCTTEACGLRDTFPKFSELNAVVLGVSTDTVSSHQKFAQKYTLPFTLLADEQRLVVEQYGVWQEKQFMGKKFMGIVRTTFIINPAGEIAKTYEKVNPKKHAEEVVEDLDKLQAK